MYKLINYKKDLIAIKWLPWLIVDYIMYLPVNPPKWFINAINCVNHSN